MGIDISFNPFSVIDNAFGFSERRRQKREDEVAQRNYSWAKEFAQNSMQWKAQDLRSAGINPLYAMGAGGYSAPVSSTSPGYDTPSASVGVSSADNALKYAQAEEFKAKARKTNAEAKAVQTIDQGIKKASDVGTDYSYLQGVDGRNRVMMSQDASEALENDMLSRLSWHGRHIAGLYGSQLEEYRNNLWNSLVLKGSVNPFTQDIVVDGDRSYIVVPRGSDLAKRDYGRQKGREKIWRDLEKLRKIGHMPLRRF